ncbi:MAG TPA: hypothetical protein VHN18_04665, partial [Micromonosporaceae bacterium]|nr:hypothetical protein [Micromonosporaceae bacterium]
NPPTGGWQIRASAAGSPDRPLDSLVAVLLGLSRNTPDPPEPLLHTDARWLGKAQAGGTEVDVMIGPATFPTAVSRQRSADARSLASMGGAVRYFVGNRSRLHRFDVLLPGGLPARLDVDRADRPQLVAIDALGGRPTQPRPLTSAEAVLLAAVRLRNIGAGGAAITMVLPAPPVADLTAQGWVNWSQSVVYLSVRPADRPGDALLLRADRDGVAATPVPEAPGTGRAPPPLPPPRDRAWTYRPWGERPGGTDLDLLVSELLWLASTDRDDVAAVRAAATWLRADSMAGARITVFEVVRPGERQSGVRDSRLRYWVDATGALRRLEVRTSVGTFAHVDFNPGDVPAIAAVPTT